VKGLVEKSTGTFSGVLSPRPQQTIVMRIALVSEHASPLAALGHTDGQSVHVAELAAGLARLGHDVTVYTRRDDPDSPTTVSSPDGCYQVVHLAAGPARRLSRDELWPHVGVRP
jgi:D-inositol-3-phosphate glycosyltransferase